VAAGTRAGSRRRSATLSGASRRPAAKQSCSVSETTLSAVRFVTRLLTVALVGASAACANAPSTSVTLLDRLGGEAMVDTIAARLVEGFASSPDGLRAFDRVKLPRVKRGLGEFLCVVADGPSDYAGDEMRICQT
jgi:hypothetical protein